MKYAQYYKCALQVNPSAYSQYRGKDKMEESEYNTQILNICKEENIRVVGLADHGSVERAENLRKLLTDNGILVFPGFEISTAEKIHIVCLFSPETDAKDPVSKLHYWKETRRDIVSMIVKEILPLRER